MYEKNIRKTTKNRSWNNKYDDKLAKKESYTGLYILMTRQGTEAQVEVIGASGHQGGAGTEPNRWEKNNFSDKLAKDYV